MVALIVFILATLNNIDWHSYFVNMVTVCLSCIDLYNFSVLLPSSKAVREYSFPAMLIVFIYSGLFSYIVKTAQNYYVFFKYANNFQRK